MDKLLFVRQTYAYGEQYDYFDHSNTIGWTRLGDEEYPGGVAVIMSNGDEGSKRMEVGYYPNQTYIDITEHISEPTTTDEQGWADFRCNAGSVSVWVQQK